MTDLTLQTDELPAPEHAAPQDAGEGIVVATDPSAEPTEQSRPDHVPDKFWDAEGGTIRTDALLKSYLELERRLGAGDATEDGDVGDTAPRPGVPETPDAYAISCTSGVVEPDPEINARLFDAGFNQEQAQLVYSLAEQYLVPAVSEAYAEVFVRQELGRLHETFGGTESWQHTADQLRNWGKANLGGDVYETLASSYDGIMAMHAMMQAREPAVVHADATVGGSDEGSLRRMMQDPRYWRDRDPTFIAEVTRGFERLFRD